jgi:preprotein translocase subunit SecA
MQIGSMKLKRHGWKLRRQRTVETDLSSYRQMFESINRIGDRFFSVPNEYLRQTATEMHERAIDGEYLDDLLPEMFALTCEIASRVLDMRPFDVQVIAGVALHRRKLVEMQTGEGKTLSAVLPAALNALTGMGVHILTFNDYLAQRDAAWMRPVYETLGLSVGTIQQGMTKAERREAYAADITYSTAKEAGFDFLRDNLVRNPNDIVQRPFHFAIVDEADSILIDEARIPLVIAGEKKKSNADPYRIAEIVKNLDEGTDWERDEHGRNVQLTDRGIDRVEILLSCGNLHDSKNSVLLSEVNQAIHAQALLLRDVDYIVRDGRIALVDEFTGRVVEDRRWPGGLQAALEAKEGLDIQPGGQILGSITLHHYLSRYPKLAGMTATAQSAADEFAHFYGLQVIPIPPNKQCIRSDLPDLIFTHREAKERAIICEITQMKRNGRPVLVGTSSVEESEHLATALESVGIHCRILNAKNDKAEAAIIAEAGVVGAVTISTNMAGRGTDIRLGAVNERERDRVASLGGLYVIGTNRHESKRIDDQLRGRAGRQGDPGTSRFFVSLEDPLMIRFGIDRLIPPKLQPVRQEASIHHPVIRREVDRLQRIVEGQNQEIRKTLARYSSIVEKQRETLFNWRMNVMEGKTKFERFAYREPERYIEPADIIGESRLREIERIVTLHHIDSEWADYLEFVSEVREGIHLLAIGGMEPLHEFHKQIASKFNRLQHEIEERTVDTIRKLETSGKYLSDHVVQGPSSTWTYLINDQPLTEFHQMLFGHGNSVIGAVAVLTTWPLLLAYGIWHKISGRFR